MGSGDSNISLDLSRDIGWFLEGQSDASQNVVLSDIRKMIEGSSSVPQYADFDAFYADYYEKSGQCGVIACNVYYPKTLKLAQRFFNEVSDVRVDERGDVCYYTDGLNCPTGEDCHQESARIFCDFEYSAESFYWMLSETDVSTTDFTQIKNLYRLPAGNGFRPLRTLFSDAEGLIEIDSERLDAEKAEVLLSGVSHLPEMSARHAASLIVDHWNEMSPRYTVDAETNLQSLSQIARAATGELDLSTEEFSEILDWLHLIENERHMEIQSRKFAEEGLGISYEATGEIPAAERVERLKRAGFGLHISDDSFLQSIAEHTQELSRFESYITNSHLTPKELLEVLTVWHYLSSDQICSLLDSLIASGSKDVAYEARAISGFSFEHMSEIVELSRPDSNFGAREAFESQYEFYMDEHFSDKFIPHRDYAESVIGDSRYDIDFVDGHMTSLFIMIESSGKKDAVSEGTGEHFGLMQIGRKAYKQITREEISNQQLRQRTMGGNWRNNVDIGVRYLEWSFETNNPTGSIGIAGANYNWGIGRTLSYRMPHIYGVGDGRALPTETRNYVIKYLIGHRMLQNEPQYQERYLQE